ncbi:ribonuclease P protein component [Urechidicola croceus]|uniref:Ribonuclease P protein component n=1 Tax=Urechidicola croceus TaxID=1850246 RepID=A0A1D8P9B4_9FLAO|nr:ribonuclease P protein component [Urechidicola croceus]AOW21149.1 ribonuclease P protein component [Urechidicola croceus]
MNFKLGKEEKLKSQKQIENLFVEGLSLKKFPLRMKYLRVETDSKLPIKVAFSVPKRNVKLAVNRNRIKRLLREAYRKNKYILLNNLEHQYVVMFIYVDKTEWAYEDLEQKMVLLMEKFIKNQ